MANSVKKFILPVLAVLIALSCAMVGSLAYFTDSASIHAGIKTNKLTGSVTETTMTGTLDSDETWLESTTTVKDGDKVLFSALTTDYKDGLGTKDSVKSFNVSRGNALSVISDSALKTNQTFKVKFTNSNAADEIFYPEIHLTALDGKSLAQCEKVLGVADASAKATLDKTVKYQNVVNGTSEDLLTANIYTIPSLVNKTKVNSDGSLSLYLEGITVKAGATVECSYALTENLNGHLDYSVPQVYVTTNATIRYPSAVNSLWYGTATAPSTTSGVIYSLAPDYQTRVLWKDVNGKYTVRGGQNAIQVTDKDAAASTEALNYTIATYQYTGSDQTPTAYLFGSKVNTKLYKAVDGKWVEADAAVERGSYKAVVDTSDVEGFTVSHTEFYFTITKAMSNVDFGNKSGPDGQPDPDNKTTWNGNTGDKEYDGKQVDIVGKDKDGNTITDFIYTNKDTGESSEVPPKDVGTYEVKPKGDENHEYTNTATVTIRKKTLQVTPTINKSSLTPTDKPSFGYTVTGFADGDNELDINGKNVQYIVDGNNVPASGQTYTVGSHDLTCSGLTAKNYDFVYGITSFAVGKGTTTVDYENKPLPDGKPDSENKLTWVNADSATKVYDGKSLSVIAKDSYGNVVDVEYYSSDGKTKLDAAPKDVGNYVVKACESDSYTYSNTAIITITKAAVTVTPVVDKTEMSYTDTVPANITYDIQGIVAGDEKYFDESEIGYIPSVTPSNTQFVQSQYNWSQNPTFKPTDYGYAGKYTLGAIPENANDKLFCKSDNYKLVYKDVTIQVNPVEVTFGTDDTSVTIKGDSATKVYDGKPIDFKFVSTENKSYWNVIYLDGSGNELKSAPKDVGTYTVRPGKSLAKYAHVSVSPTIIITPAPLTATAKTDTTTYTPTKKPVLSYELTGFVNGETETVVDTTGLKYMVDGNEVESSGKVYATGSHTVSISGLTASNYAISYVNATFTVAKHKVTVTYDESGDNKTLSWTGDVATKVYDGQPAIVIGVDSEGNVIADILYVSSDGTSSTTPPTAVGTYTIKPASNEDYEYTNNGTLIITPAPLKVTVGDVQVKDNEKPEFAVAYSGFVNGETVDAVVTGTPTYTVTKDGAEVTADENDCYTAGEYTVTVSGLTAANYSITFKAGTMTVTRSAIHVDITVPSAEKVYDGLPIEDVVATTSDGMTVEVSYVNRNTGVETKSAPKDVGTYDIKLPDGYEADSATVVITKAPLTITLHDAKTSETVAPQYTYTVSDFVANEDEKVLGGHAMYKVSKNGSEIAKNSFGSYSAGTYDVEINGFSSDNYEIAYVGAHLTVRLPIAQVASFSDNYSLRGDGSTPTSGDSDFGVCNNAYIEHNINMRNSGEDTVTIHPIVKVSVKDATMKATDLFWCDGAKFRDDIVSLRTTLSFPWLNSSPYFYDGHSVFNMDVVENESKNYAVTENADGSITVDMGEIQIPSNSSKTNFETALLNDFKSFADKTQRKITFDIVCTARYSDESVENEIEIFNSTKTYTVAPIDDYGVAWRDNTKTEDWVTTIGGALTVPYNGGETVKYPTAEYYRSAYQPMVATYNSIKMEELFEVTYYKNNNGNWVEIRKEDIKEAGTYKAVAEFDAEHTEYNHLVNLTNNTIEFTVKQ